MNDSLPKGDSRKGVSALLFLGTAALLVGVIAVLVFRYTAVQNERDTAVAECLLAGEYYPVEQVMRQCGFAPAKDGTFVKEENGARSIVTFDTANNVCRKNQYSFDISGKWLVCDGQLYCNKSLLEAITNHQLFLGAEGGVIAKKVRYAAGKWLTTFEPLIAHAGGIFRGPAKNQVYSNTLDAVVQNYDLGHRVFEIDFQVTSDGNLAAVHAGWVPGDENGITMTAKEWLGYGGFWPGKTMLIADVFDQMQVNADMFVVTDTKWQDSRAFKIMYEEARKRDISLLNRVIPQIYSIAMYDTVMEVYAFPSVIFTDYATSETPEEIVAFCAGKANIHAITTSMPKGRVSEKLLGLAAKNNLPVYTHTVNAYDNITTLRKAGVYGLYTDYLLPADFALYKKIAREAKK
ncbi:MAG: hypothetical protein DELT_02751 [Desulfovibrio sp.]